MIPPGAGRLAKRGAMLKLALASGLMVATAAVSQAPADAPARSGPDNDPDQVVCVTETAIGSRLGARRVCRTRAEWTEHRSESRGVVDRVQYFKPTVCNAPGAPSC
jgi:hypothetical protein